MYKDESFRKIKRKTIWISFCYTSFLRNYDLKQTCLSVAWHGVTCKACQSLWVTVLKLESLISVCFWLVCQLSSGEPIWYIFLLWKDMSVKMTDSPQALCGEAMIPSSLLCNCSLPQCKSNPVIHTVMNRWLSKGHTWTVITSSLSFQSIGWWSKQTAHVLTTQS